MSVAIMTSGGDAAGMNPAIKRFVEICFERGLTPYLIHDGLEGLIDDRIVEADHQMVAGIIYRGGTIIRSSRSKRFFEYDYRKQAYENLKKRGIDKLLVLGGDGSFRALNQFYKDFGVTYAGVPATIDNDIFGTDYCLGVDTALNVIRTAIDEIRDTASSFRRAFVIEVMGRDCGYLALVSALTSGAEICLVPEIECDQESLRKRYLKEIEQGRNYIIAIVAEGVKKAQHLTTWLEQELHMESRMTILGHIQRGGSPTVYDRLMAFEFVTKAMDGLLGDNPNNIVVYKGSQFGYQPVEYITSDKYQINPMLMDLGIRLSR